MFGLFSKPDPNENNKVNLFQSLLSAQPLQGNIVRHSYRKKGKYEIIYDGNQMSDLTSPENQSIFNLLGHAWMIIWGNDQAELHVGVTNRVGYRVIVTAASLYIGHKFSDHDEILKKIVSFINQFGAGKTESIMKG